VGLPRASQDWRLPRREAGLSPPVPGARRGQPTVAFLSSATASLDAEPGIGSRDLAGNA
jgi:hypothetical protein